MSPELRSAREGRGLPPYRREPSRVLSWTTAEVARATGLSKQAVAQRVRRGHFPGAVKVPDSACRDRWLIPDAAARAFIRLRTDPPVKA